MFKPMKPLKVSFDVLITKKEGSRWRYRLVLEGTEPEVDDIIEIESNLMVTSSVAFKMTNVEKVSAPFKAKFTSDSGTASLIQPMSSQSSPRRASWRLTTPRAPTSTCPTPRWSTGNKRRASSSLKQLTCAGLTFSREAFPSTCLPSSKAAAPASTAFASERLFLIMDNRYHHVG